VRIVDRYVSPPLDLPPHDPDVPLGGADLLFYEVQHRGLSYVAHIFLGQPDATIETPRTAEHGYAGSFTVFGHGGCYGDAGHCNPELRTTDAFDLRPPHALTPINKTVAIGEALRRVTGTTVVVTVVAVRPGETAPEPADDMQFSSLRLATYVDTDPVAAG
jgi:hypothetical protein